MKNQDLFKSIEMLENQIQYLHNDYKTLLNRHNAFTDISNILRHIKQAEESLRLKKRMLVGELN